MSVHASDPMLVVEKPRSRSFAFFFSGLGAVAILALAVRVEAGVLAHAMPEWAFVLLAVIAGWVCLSCVFALALGQSFRRLSEETSAPPLPQAHSQARNSSGGSSWPTSGPTIPKPTHSALLVPR